MTTPAQDHAEHVDAVAAAIFEAVNPFGSKWADLFVEDARELYRKAARAAIDAMTARSALQQKPEARP